VIARLRLAASMARRRPLAMSALNQSIAPMSMPMSASARSTSKSVIARGALGRITIRVPPAGST